MGLLDKLPLILSPLSVASSIAVPMAINNEEEPKIAKPEQKEEEVVVKQVVKYTRKVAPLDSKKRLEDALMKYVDCIDKKDAIKELCRQNHWFWDV